MKSTPTMVVPVLVALGGRLPLDSNALFLHVYISFIYIYIYIYIIRTKKSHLYKDITSHELLLLLLLLSLSVFFFLPGVIIKAKTTFR